MQLFVSKMPLMPKNVSTPLTEMKNSNSPIKLGLFPPKSEKNYKNTTEIKDISISKTSKEMFLKNNYSRYYTKSLKFKVLN